LRRKEYLVQKERQEGTKTIQKLPERLSEQSLKRRNRELRGRIRA